MKTKHRRESKQSSNPFITPSRLIPRLLITIMLRFKHFLNTCLLLTGVTVTAFSLSQYQSIRSSVSASNSVLHMSSANLSGKIIGKRHIYKLSSQSQIQTPYSIEERQYYAVGRNGSLKPVTDKFIIVRGEVSSTTGEVLQQDQTMIGPALYGMAGLQDGSDLLELEGTSVDSSYAMALYCMQNPQVVQGKGLELGW